MESIKTHRIYLSLVFFRENEKDNEESDADLFKIKKAFANSAPNAGSLSLYNGKRFDIFQ